MNDEVSLRRHLAILRRGLFQIVLLTVCGAFVALAVNAVSPRLYESRARIVVGPVPIVARPDINDLLAAQRVATTFADLATTTRFLERVKDRLGLPDSVEQLRERILSLVPPESSFIDIIVRDRDPATAARLANEVAAEIVDAAPQGISDDPAGEDVPRQLSIWDVAVAADAPSSPRVLMNLLVGLLAGLIAGVALAYAHGYLRDKVLDVEDLEQLSGAPVLGELRSQDIDGDHVTPAALARLTKRLELLGAPPARLLIASVGKEPVGWLGEEVAAEFATLGRSTLLVRLDALAHRNAIPGSGLDALLTGAIDARAVTEPAQTKGLRRVRPTSGTETAAELATADQMAVAMAALSEVADWMILTSDAPTESLAALMAAPATTNVLLLAGIGRTRRRDAAAVAAALRSVGAGVAGVIAVHRFPKVGSDGEPRRARPLAAPTADHSAPR